MVPAEAKNRSPPEDSQMDSRTLLLSWSPSRRKQTVLHQPPKRQLLFAAFSRKILAAAATFRAGARKRG
jgi:hypothetical protein